MTKLHAPMLRIRLSFRLTYVSFESYTAVLFFAKAMCSSSRRSAILVIGGAFSPVHAGHVAAIEAAKRQAEDLGFQVVAGYLACAPDGYTCRKYGSSAICGSARLEMCNLVAKEHPLLLETPKLFGSAKECGRAMLENHLPGTEILVVCGPDKAQRGRKENHLYVQRDEEPGAGAQHLSATLVRERLRGSEFQEACKELVEEGCLSAAVGDYIMAHPEAFAGVLGAEA